VSETTQGASLDPRFGGSGPVGWTLVIVGPGSLRTHVLPSAGEVVIGRDADCEIQIDHPRISRKHARLRLGSSCAVEDLGSRNGTVIAGSSLPAGTFRTLSAGESFGLGPFTLVLVSEQGAAASPAPSSLLVEDPAPSSPPAILVTVARSPLTVLVRGETGAGKEILAETLHRLSGRTGPLLRLNCASFSAELLESELFGHERGAFSGAVVAKPGLLEVAGGGTVFLDEIGELPPPLQAKLLRAIESREVLHVGGTKPVPIDVRFIAATNRDLQAEIARGAFRLDLYYRLAVLTLTLPPLRERPARIITLAHELATTAAARASLPPPRISPAAVARLQAHSWPGNVRELRNVIERALLLAHGAEIGGEHIIIDHPVVAAAASAPPVPGGPDPAPPVGGGATARSAPSIEEPDAAERRRIIDALEQCAGNQTRAAKLLGMSRATLATKLSIHRIPRPRR
jgi:transcriptional regulator with GAF, ATPase, and Fis domain